MTNILLITLIIIQIINTTSLILVLKVLKEQSAVGIINETLSENKNYFNDDLIQEAVSYMSEKSLEPILVPDNNGFMFLSDSVGNRVCALIKVVDFNAKKGTKHYEERLAEVKNIIDEYIKNGREVKEYAKVK